MDYGPLETMLKAQPFERFLMRGVDGQSFRVDHPELLVATPTKRSVIFFEPSSAEGDYMFRIIDLSLISTIEPVRPMPDRPAKRKNKGK